jgi:hypothetical protein
MKAVTLRLSAAPTGQKGYVVALHEGEPSDKADAAQIGAVLAPPEPLKIDAADADLRALQSDLLTTTERIFDFERRAQQVGALLLPGQVRSAWLARMREAAQATNDWALRRAAILKDPRASEEDRRFAREHPGCRTYLHFVTTDLAWIPWEVARLSGTLFLKGDAPIARFLSQPGRRPRQPDWQVKVLIVVAAANADAIGAPAEVRAVRRACRPLDRIYDVDIIQHPTRKALFDRLKNFKPHILHFIGHGAGDALQISNGKNTERWGATQIQTDLSTDSWIPEFAYLNACRTFTAAQDDERPHQPTAEERTRDLERQRGMVDTLLELGVNGVVAMQADVRGNDAAICAGAFYQQLVQGADVDVAVARGRAQHRATDSWRRGGTRRLSARPDALGTRRPHPPPQVLDRTDAEHLRP